ncbi:MAG: AMIN domain-containing protein [Thermoanaerobaculia bacterium]|nr:AMIN domain-containing protein [Thermoanaerobaculia bacterium]
MLVATRTPSRTSAALRAAAALWLASAGAVAAAPRSEPPRTATIVSSAVTDAGVELALSRAVAPTPLLAAGGSLSFELDDTRTGYGVVNQIRPGGALAELRFVAIGVPSRPRTRIVVVPRGAVAPRLVVAGDRLRLELLPPTPPPPAPPRAAPRPAPTPSLAVAPPKPDPIVTRDVAPLPAERPPAAWSEVAPPATPAGALAVHVVPAPDPPAPEPAPVPLPEPLPELPTERPPEQLPEPVPEALTEPVREPLPAPPDVALRDLAIEPLDDRREPPAPREVAAGAPPTALAWTIVADAPPAFEPPPAVGEESVAPEPPPAPESLLLPDELATPPASSRLAPPAPPAPPAAAAPGPATRLLAVELAAPGVVRLAADGVLDYLAFRLESPERFVIELAGVVNASSAASLAVDEALLVRVRLLQYRSLPRPVTRVVFDLRAPSIPEIASTPAGLVVRFVRAARTGAALPIAPRDELGRLAAARRSRR